MLVQKSLPKQSIIDCLHAHYGIEVVALTLLPLGADPNASVYQAEAKDGMSYFVKAKTWSSSRYWDNHCTTIR